MTGSFKTMLLCSLVLLLQSCSQDANTVKEQAMLERSAWLLGRWHNVSDKGVATESWEKINDSTYAGSSYFIVGKDTVSAETISLVQAGHNVFYIPTVKEQNNAQPVPFKLTSGSNDQLVFENAAHDFPQKITYTKMSDDSLVAEISGLVKGKLRKQQFPMARVK